MIRRQKIRRIVTILLVGLSVLLLVASARDFQVSDESADAPKKSDSIYRPRSIADALVLVAEINTYLYHEERCQHLDEENADRLWRSTLAGVKLDFPGWRAVDSVVLRLRIWRGRFSVDGISCTKTGVENPSYITNNINYYSARKTDQ